MKLIFVDTSTPHVRLALLENADLICEKACNTHNGQTSHVLQFSEDLLKKAHWKVEDLEGVIVCTGPGSFTGLRIGVSFAKTLAFTLNIPLCGISSLDALALEAKPSSEAFVVPLIDARRGELYGKIFSYHPENKMSVLEEASVLSPDKWLEKLKSKKGTFYLCGNGVPLYKDIFMNELKLAETNISALPQHASPVSFLSLAKAKLSSGGMTQEKVLPLYIRPSDAEKNKSSIST